MLQFAWQTPVKSYTLTLRGRRGKLILPNLPSAFEIARNSYVNNAAEVRCFRTMQQVKIGSYSSVGRCKFMVDGDHAVHFASTFPFRELGLSKTAVENKNIKPVPIVGNDVWIADETTILGGVIINDGAVIAANSVVTKDVPPYAVVAGNPARVVKYRFNEEMVERYRAVKWWDMPDEFVYNELAPFLDQPLTFLERAENKKNNSG